LATSQEYTRAAHLISPVGTSDHDLVRLRVIPHPHMFRTLSDLIQHPLPEILKLDDIAIDIVG
jgi:hypothetical protein